MSQRSVIRLVVGFAVVIGLVAVTQAIRRQGGRQNSVQPGGGTTQGNAKYQCSMHPQIVQDRPGKCPICAMDLQPVAAKEQSQAGRRSSTPLYYRHPMNPSVISPVPAKDDMGMSFIPVYEEAGPSAVEGRAPVTINLYKQQLIGVSLGFVERRSLTRTIYTTGRIAYDPGLYQAQAEYLSVLRAYDLAKQSPVPGAEDRAGSLLEASRLRLHLLGLSEEQMVTLAETGRPERNLLVASEDGTVWIYADIYEQELPWVRVGQVVEATLPNQPGRRFKGSVIAMDPNLDMKTRSAKIRAELSSSEGFLRPGMYMNAMIHVDLGERLVVPRSAVLDTGKRQIVFVALGEGRFEPREVGLGVRGTDAIEVLSGLDAGERVVTSGNFLMDAESQLRGAAGMTFYSGREAAEGSDPSTGTGTASHD